MDATLHRRILAEIEGNIVSGTWAPGQKIASETELAARYGCSRMTVNKVLTQLARAGLVERKRRVGTVVLQPRAQSAVLAIHDIEAEVLSLGKPYAFALLRRTVRRATAADRALLDLPPGGKVLELVSRHDAGKTPFCLEQRLINLATVPEAADAVFTAAPGKWLVAQVPWTSAEHRIHAAGADAAVAEALRIAPGAACLVVQRRTWSGAGSVTHVTQTYPGERHALVATFAPAG